MADQVIAELSLRGLGSVLRMIMRGRQDDVTAIRAMTYSTLQRLRVGRDLSKAATKLPKGSDQFDTGSLRDWLAKIKPGDEKAIEQIVIIDATAVSRS
jgi:hypothetical protein